MNTYDKRSLPKIHLVNAMVLTLTIGAAFSGALYASAADGHDWPTCRGSNTRGSFLDADIPTDLELLWHYHCKQAPEPAWPPPARGSYWQELTHIVPRIIDDQTFHPVLTTNAVLFASSADDTVYCLDSNSGSVRWYYTTDGPVRYAPYVVNDMVYFGSDDGSVYCVQLRTGELVWRRRLAPEDRRIPGNGRIISAWPVRTGVAVADGIVYVGAGLYPSQGVQLAALAADSGEPVWQRQIDYTAHGYLLISQDRLVVPTGRSTPIVLSRADGSLLGQLPGSPGTYAVVSSREVLSGRGNSTTLSATEIGAKESLVSMQAEHVCVAPSQSYFAGHGLVQAVDLVQFMETSRKLVNSQRMVDELEEELERLRSLLPIDKKPLGGDSASTIVIDQMTSLRKMESKLEQELQAFKQLRAHRKACKRWEWPLPGIGCLAAANNAVVVGTKDALQIRDMDTGEVLNKLSMEGLATGIALSRRRLVITTRAGDIYCFASKSSQSSNRQSIKPVSAATRSSEDAKNRWQAKLAALVDKHVLPTFVGTKGYAIVAGGGDSDLVSALCEQTEYKIVVVDNDPAVVERLRRELLDQGLYGTRCAVHLVDSGQLPFADYSANLVISSRRIAGQNEQRWSVGELLRVLRPAGGIAWLDEGITPRRRGPLAGAGRWVHQYGNTGNTAASGDQFTHWDLRLQWFGGPGPARMVDRHLRAPAPLVADGRMFISGENSVVCVDSYNGTEYWQLDAPESQRYSMPYDCGYSSVDGDRFAMAVRDAAWIVDVATGKVEEQIPLPGPSPSDRYHWGYLAQQGDQLFGSIQKATASRTAPSRQLIDLDYTNARPIVTGMALFRLDRESKQTVWQHDALVLNPTIASAADRVYFVEATDQALREHATGRIALEELLTGGAQVVSLDAKSGEVIWQQPLDQHLSICNNILYLQSVDDLIVLSGSYTRDNDSWYRVAVLDAGSGATMWTSEHQKGDPGEFGHGEQVHHPVVLGDRLVCEPVIYELRTGKRIGPGGESPTWTLVRPAHSCGTMSGAGNCLFFRSGNPTVMDLSSELQGSDRFRSISPSRPGCWINIIPADGLVLIPEASASCVCHYSLQTSMAFQPVARQTVSAP